MERNKLFRSYSTWRIIYRIVKNRISWKGPFFLCHLVTGKCNCQCESCLWRDNASEDLSTDEITHLYSQARDLGFVANVIWGGEPLMRKDFPKIARASKDMNFITTVITNGYFLQERLHELKDNVDSFIVSLDMPDERHDALRKQPGIFKRAISGIQSVREKYPQIKVMINCILINENKGLIKEMADLAMSLDASLYLSPIEIDLLKSSGFEKRKLPLKPAKDEETEVANLLIELKKNGYKINNSKAFFENLKQGKAPYTCHFPKIMMQIGPNGDVIDCMAWDRPIGNVRKQPLREIYFSPRIKELAGPLGEQCNKCNNPNRIDLSFMWELKREPLKAMVEMFLSG